MPRTRHNVCHSTLETETDSALRSWLNQHLAGQNLALISLLLYIVGIILLLIPAVPGVPVYLVTSPPICPIYLVPIYLVSFRPICPMCVAYDMAGADMGGDVATRRAGSFSALRAQRSSGPSALRCSGL